MDYARRYAGQRRLAGAGSILMWIMFVGRDWWLLNALDPSILFDIGYVRLAGVVGMAVPIWLMWGPRGLDERWAVRCLFLGTLSSWLALLGLMMLYPIALAGREIFPGFLLILFVIFTSFRLRAITAAWLVGLCAVTFNLTELYLYLWPWGNVSTLAADTVSRGTMVSIMYLVGIVVCIQFELAARREFVFRRTLRAAKARIEAASRAVNQQNERMKELVKEKEGFF